jgi:hypothetical protein
VIVSLSGESVGQKFVFERVIWLRNNEGSKTTGKAEDSTWFSRAESGAA